MQQDSKELEDHSIKLMTVVAVLSLLVFTLFWFAPIS